MLEEHRGLALAAVVACVAVFVLGLLRGEPPLLMLVAALSLAVAAVPESLPVVVTLGLALGDRCGFVALGDAAAVHVAAAAGAKAENTPAPTIEPSPMTTASVTPSLRANPAWSVIGSDSPRTWSPSAAVRQPGATCRSPTDGSPNRARRRRRSAHIRRHGRRRSRGPDRAAACADLQGRTRPARFGGVIAGRHRR